MTENEAIKEFQQNIDMPFGSNISRETSELAIQALETVKKLSDRNMTIEVLENYMQFEDECVKKGFTLKSLIEAREKQIAKKPIVHQCATCGSAVLPFEGKCCSECGQRLDWGDSD